MVDIVPGTTADRRFAFEQAGPADGPPLVFLHGIGGAARAFRPQLKAFGARFRAIAWDMPGYGGSAPLAQTSIATLTAALRDFLAAVDAPRPILVGHSIGGMIVQQFLSESPQGAAAVVLAQTSPAFGKPDGDWQKAFIDARVGPLDRGETMASLAPKLVADLVGDDPDPEGLALARDCMASVPEATYRAVMHALLGFDQRAALAQIAVPALVLSGTRDTNAPAPMMAKMAGFIPGARYVALDRVGHLAGLERPHAFNTALEEFFSTLPKRTT